MRPAQFPQPASKRRRPKLFDIGARPLSDDNRIHMPELAIADRDNFDEIELGFDDEAARKEAARCLQCLPRGFRLRAAAPFNPLWRRHHRVQGRGPV